MTESRFELRTFSSDTMLNYHLFQKLKLIGRGKFNRLINTLTLVTIAIHNMPLEVVTLKVIMSIS
jgi:hypothetical protein